MLNNGCPIMHMIAQTGTKEKLYNTKRTLPIVEDVSPFHEQERRSLFYIAQVFPPTFPA